MKQADPIRLLRRRRRATSVVGAVAVLAAGLWAGRVPSREPIAMGRPAPAPPDAEEERPGIEPLDLAAFSVSLWNPPPPPPPEADPPSAEETRVRRVPVRLQLVAIIDEGGGRCAVLYDPDQDELRFVRAGEAVASAVVESISETTVRVGVGNSSRTLALLDDDGASDR